MIKFAFIANVTGVTPETYRAVFETANSYNLIAGVDGIEAGKEYVKKLADEGFGLFNLCGDFDDDVTAEIQEMVGEGVKVRNAKYTIDQMMKLQFVERFKDYGIIIQDDDVEKYHEEVIRSKDCDARIIFVKDLRQAKHAAERLIEKRVDFIELCSWFDVLRLETMVEATGNRVPIGTCGELNPLNIK